MSPLGQNGVSRTIPPLADFGAAFGAGLGFGVGEVGLAARAGAAGAAAFLAGVSAAGAGEDGAAAAGEGSGIVACGTADATGSARGSVRGATASPVDVAFGETALVVLGSEGGVGREFAPVSMEASTTAATMSAAAMPP